MSFSLSVPYMHPANSSFWVMWAGEITSQEHLNKGRWTCDAQVRIRLRTTRRCIRYLPLLFDAGHIVKEVDVCVYCLDKFLHTYIASRFATLIRTERFYLCASFVFIENKENKNWFRFSFCLRYKLFVELYFYQQNTQILPSDYVVGFFFNIH